jgi:hypothetical protein
MRHLFFRVLIPGVFIVLSIVLTVTAYADPGTVSTPPTTIRVAHLNADGTVASVTTVTFYDPLGTSDYVQNVLPNEWACLWPAESLKAGAMAVKMYGWFHTMNPSYPVAGADVDDTTGDQLYVPNSANTDCTSALRSLDHQGMRRENINSHRQLFHYIFETRHCAGTYADDRYIPCSATTPGDFLSQNGSHYFADPPNNQDYQTILTEYYYGDVDFGPYTEFFAY